MIQANELRIGNYFKDKNFVLRCYGITNTENDGTKVFYSKEGGSFYLRTDAIEPILLTHKILAAAGFEGDSWVKLKFDDLPDGQIMIHPETLDAYLMQFGSAGIRPECKYLHQLQNLYFSLVGSELEIKNIDRILSHTKPKSLTTRDLLATRKVLNFDEGCIYTGFKPSYMYKLTSGGKIPYSKPNGKTIFFDREKLDKWLLRNNLATDEELEIKASTYLAKQKLDA